MITEIDIASKSFEVIFAILFARPESYPTPPHRVVLKFVLKFP
jgi:hypothetical protein